MKTLIICDGPGFSSAISATGVKVDYNLVVDHFSKFEDDIVLKEWWSWDLAADAAEGVVRFLDWVEYNGWSVRWIENRTAGEGARVRRSLAPDVTAGVIPVASRYDRIVLLASESEYKPLIDYLTRNGVYVVLVAPKDGCSDHLIRASSEFIDLGKKPEWLVK